MVPVSKVVIAVFFKEGLRISVTPVHDNLYVIV